MWFIWELAGRTEKELIQEHITPSVQALALLDNSEARGRTNRRAWMLKQETQLPHCSESLSFSCRATQLEGSSIK